MEHKMKKALSWLLTLALVLGMVPALSIPVLAANEVKFANVTLTDKTYYKVNDSAITPEGASSTDYNVYLDGSTLTLNNVRYNGEQVAVSYSNADSSFTIHLLGENSLVTTAVECLEIRANLTITAETGGTLNAACNNSAATITTYGIMVYGNAVIATGATVSASCGTAGSGTATRVGVYAKSLTVQSGAKLTAIGGATTDYSYGVKISDQTLNPPTYSTSITNTVTVDGTLYANTNDGSTSAGGSALQSRGIYCGALTSSGTAARQRKAAMAFIRWRSMPPEEP